MKPPIYYTQRFILKPYEKSDLQRFIEIGTDKDVIKFMGDENTNESSERKLFENIFDIYKRQDEHWFWIWGIYKENTLVGHFELKETEHTNSNELEIVYMVHPNERKRGVMSEVLSFAKNKQTDWNKKIIATIDFENFNSISLLEKWGINKKKKVKDKETEEHYYKLWLE